MKENYEIYSYNIKNCIFIEKYSYNNVWEIKNDNNENLELGSKFLRIDYCSKGLIIGKFHNGTYSKLEAGQVAINKNSPDMVSHIFNLGFYEGFSFLIDIERIKNDYYFLFNDFEINLDRLIEKIPDNLNWGILDSNLSLTKLCEYLDYLLMKYENDKKIISKVIFFNVMEILCLIESIHIRENDSDYFSKKDAIVLKNIIFDLNKQNKVISIDEIIKISGLSRSNFYKLFYKIFAISPGLYLKKFYLSRAKHLIEKTDLSMIEISQLIGYKNPSKFSNAFKKQYGISPSKYRKI